MADLGPKSAHVGTEHKSHYERDSVSEAIRPAGWMYKSLRVGSWAMPWYASPRFQLGLVAFVCFMCPGMYNALTGLGGAGKADHSLADDMVSFFFPHTLHLFFLFLRGVWTDPRVEHCPLQYFRRRWLLRRHHCQSHRCASGYVLWWHWLHSLRH